MINYAETEKFHTILYAWPGVFAFLRHNYFGLCVGGDWSGLIG